MAWVASTSIRLLASFGRVLPNFFKRRSSVSRSFLERTAATFFHRGCVLAKPLAD
jgi:hypothetical protein